MSDKEEKKKVVGGDGLVDGETTYGEDVKGNSTFHEGKAPATVENKDAEVTSEEQESTPETETPAEEPQTPEEKAAETVQDQKVAEAKSDAAAEKAAKK